MSQEVMIAGAVFSDVPSIRVPDSNNVFHSFTDVTDTTATASDVASGKYFYAADGTKTAGTSSGGGGGAVKLGVLRPDAELVKSWTYDKLIVEDEGATIPAYSTSSTTLKSSETLETVTIDLESYEYEIAIRTLTEPIYNDDTIGSGRFVKHVLAGVGEITYVNPGMVTDQGHHNATASGPAVITNSRYYNVYYNSSSAITVTSSTNGTFQVMPTWSVSATGVTIKDPSFTIRGHSSQLSSKYWGYLTDVRYQYIIELYRVPVTDQVRGFFVKSQISHAFDCSQTGDHTLS